jgi:hypothetical protein
MLCIAEDAVQIGRTQICEGCYCRIDGYLCRCLPPYHIFAVASLPILPLPVCVRACADTINSSIETRNFESMNPQTSIVQR